MLMCKCAVICVGLAAHPVSASQSETRSKLPRDAHLPSDKYANVKSSGYGRQLTGSKPTASKSAYSPLVKPRPGQHSDSHMSSFISVKHIVPYFRLLLFMYVIN